MGEDRPSILIVEDEPDVAETYELWLAGDYEIRHARDGDEALAAIDESVDVVLLDRMMPRMSGDEVLAELRERGYDCKVAMVTAVDPDFEIIEMGFDDYVTKPPTRDELVGTVEDLLARGEYAAEVQESRSLLATRDALAEEKSDAELAESDEFAELEARIERAEAELEREQDRFVDDATFVSAIRELTEDDA